MSRAPWKGYSTANQDTSAALALLAVAKHKYKVTSGHRIGDSDIDGPIYLLVGPKQKLRAWFDENGDARFIEEK